MPVSKSPVTNASLSALDLSASTLSPDSARHFLYAGTKVVRARRPHDDGSEEAVALAMVVRTGFNTTKGALVRSMLFPKPSGFKFYRDSFRYITVMAGVAVVAFIVSFVNFIRLGLSWHLIIVRALDLITIVVPPALPATLTIGINFAISRLKKRQIFCISPQRVNVGGKLDIMCFDKTGTLTEEGLDVLGVRVVSPERRTFEDLVTTADALVSDPNTAPHAKDAERTHRAVLYTMATCHSLREVNDELVGDPLDLKMFEFTGWSFEEGKHTAADADDAEQGGITPSVARPPADKKYGLDQNGFIRDEEVGDQALQARCYITLIPLQRPLELGLLRSFEFVSNLRRASVIVRAFGSQSGDVFVKGAPECMRDICRADSCKYWALEYTPAVSWLVNLDMAQQPG